MATISNLVAKLILDDAGFTAGATRAAGKIAVLTAKVAALAPGVRVVTASVQTSARAFEEVDTKASSYLKTLLKIGSAGAIIATGVKAAFNAEKTAAKVPAPPAKPSTVSDVAVKWSSGYSMMLHDSGKAAADAAANAAALASKAPAVLTLGGAYERVTGAVTRAYEAFGKSFSASAGLASLLDVLANVVSNLTPLFETMGSVLGGIVGFFTRFSPLAVALAVAFKVLMVAGIALLVVLKALLISKLTVWLLGMTPLSLAWAAATWLVTTAHAALAAVITYIMAIGGGLMWLAIAAAVAVVAAGVWLLVAAYKYLTTTADDTKLRKNAEALNALAESAKKTNEAIDDLSGKLKNDIIDLQNQLANPGVSAEALKDIAELKSLYKDAVDLGQVDLDAQLQKKIAMAHQRESLKGQVENMKQLADLAIKTQQAYMTPGQKAADDHRRRGGSAEGQQQILRSNAAIEIVAKTKEREKQLAEQIADMEKTARQAGMTDFEKRLDNMKELVRLTGGRFDEEKRIADLTSRATALEREAKTKQELADLMKDAAQIQLDAELAGLSAAETRVALMKRGGVTGDALATAQAAAKQMDAVEKRQKDMEEGKRLSESVGPLEKFQKAAADIARLRGVGAINDAVAKQALGAAHKDFLGTLKDNDSFKLESPKAILKGTAEAELAQDRQKSPLEKLTEIQKQHLAVATRAKAVADQQLAAIEANKPKPSQVASIN